MSPKIAQKRGGNEPFFKSARKQKIRKIMCTDHCLTLWLWVCLSFSHFPFNANMKADGKQ